MKGGAAIANILKQEGVEYIFCFPNNPLIDAAASVGIRPIITRIERTAVNMAMGYARTNGGSPMAVCVFPGRPRHRERLRRRRPGIRRLRAHPDSAGASGAGASEPAQRLRLRPTL